MHEFIFKKDFWKKRHFIFIDFACKTDSKQVKLNTEGSDYKWVTLQQALKMSIDPYTRKTILAYMKKKGRKA